MTPSCHEGSHRSAGRARDRCATRRCPSPRRAPGRSSSRPSRWGSAGPTSRSPRAPTAGPHRAATGCPRPRVPGSGRSTRGRQPGCRPGTSSSGIVRRPDPVPCSNCAVGEWDMCRNGQYTERGIKQLDGFMSERWRIEPGYFTKLDPSLGLLGVLLEPTTVVAKAWELVAAMRARAFWEPRHGARHRRRPDRHARRAHRRAARPRGPRARPRHGGPQAPAGARPRCHLPLRARGRPGLRARRHHRVHRGGSGDRRLDPQGRAPAGWSASPASGSGGPPADWSPADLAPRGRAAEQRHRRLRQRQPAALLPRRPRRSPRPTGTGSRA